MSVGTLNNWIIALSALAALISLGIISLNHFKNVLTEERSAAQRKTIEGLRAQVKTVRACQITLSIFGTKRPHVMRAEVAPLLPTRDIVLMKDGGAPIRFLADGRGRIVDDSGDGPGRELRLSYEIPHDAPLIGQQIEGLAGYRDLVLHVADIVAIANLRDESPVVLRWTLRVNAVEVAAAEIPLPSPADLTAERRFDVSQKLAEVLKHFEAAR